MYDKTSPVALYDRRTISLHWLTAALVLILWTVGQCIDLFPKGEPRIYVRSLHITLGLLLAMVVIRRIVWRAGGGRRLAPAAAGAGAKLVAAGHYLLYALLLGVVALGLVSVWARGDSIFTLFTVPAFDPGNRELPEQVVDVHGLLADSLLVLASLHAALALYHHWVLRDGVLRRMLPGRAAAALPAAAARSSV